MGNDRAGDGKVDGRSGPVGATLLPVIYDELKRLAASKMAREAPGHTLQATALVHEAWLKLQNQRQPGLESRTSYFKAAAETMRRLLIDRARAKRAAKRDGISVPLTTAEAVEFSSLQVNASDDEMVSVDEALEELSRFDATAADLVKLRHFVGMTMTEAAEAMEMPLRTAERRWAFARAWLRRAIERRSESNPSEEGHDTHESQR